LTNLEKEQWDALYQYVKKEILMYDENQSIPRDLILKLKGLVDGKVIANKNTKAKANYGFDIVLLTYKMCKANILNAIQTKDFKNEFNKMQYICAIIENNINDVYIRLQKTKNTQEKIETLNTDVLQNESAEYQHKTSNKQNNRLEELW